MIPGCLEAQNISMMHNRQDHEKLVRELKRGIKKVTVLGANLESLELVSTIRREYPKVHITVIDENRENYLETQLGKEVAKSLIQ